MAEVPKMVVHVNDDAYWRRHYAGLAMAGLLADGRYLSPGFAIRYAEELLAELKKREASDAAQ